jgi:phage tail tube protein FII
MSYSDNPTGPRTDTATKYLYLDLLKVYRIKGGAAKNGSFEDFVRQTEPQNATAVITYYAKLKRELQGGAKALDAAPSNLAPGDRISVNGRLLKVKHVTTGTEDLFGEPTVQVRFETGEVVPYLVNEDVQKAKAQDSAGDPLTLDYIVRREVRKPAGDQRRQVYVVTASYRGADGYEYRKSFESYDDYITPPVSGTRKTLNALRESWRGRTKAQDSDSPGTEITIHGLPVIIEIRRGQWRVGPGWRQRMAYDYGYFKNVKGADGDSLDICIGPNPESEWIYIVDQKHLLPGKGFDEHKCFVGYDSLGEAVKAFNAGHDRACQVYLDITPMQLEEFKKWLKTGNHTKPVGGVKA